MVTSRVLLSGRYMLDERIGAGGHSEVWRAADLTLARLVAVKLLYAGFAQHADALARFRAEARHAARLNHENIARVYDYGEPDDSRPPFLVMELIDGPSLDSVLLGGPLEPARTAQVIAQAAAGLQAAHQAGLIHRDIKPGNLLVSPDGTVKVADFGISHAVGAEPMTGTGLLLGTPGYLAPERVTGGSATPASDLYALGVVAWECLAGRPPYTGPALEVALAHRDQGLPPLPAGVPPALADLVAELTARDPRDRPSNAAVVTDRARELTQATLAAVRAERPCAGLVLDMSPAGIGPAGTGPAGVALAGQSGWPTQPVTDQLGRRPAGAGTPAGGHVGRWRRPRRVLLAVAAVVAMLAGGLAASQIGPLAPSRVAAQPSSHALPRATGTQLITVSADFLAGQSVAVVAGRLRREGLKVRVRWQVSSVHPPGTVLSVSPSGYRPAGSLVTLVGARAPTPAGQASAPFAATGAGPGPGHGKGEGHGNGGGGGGGGGDGGGNGDGGGDGGGGD
jgi:eukaryotic-like serine/threonine-protein kinase